MTFEMKFKVLIWTKTSVLMGQKTFLPLKSTITCSPIQAFVAHCVSVLLSGSLK